MFKDIYDYNLPLSVERQFTFGNIADYKYTLLYFHKIVAGTLYSMVTR